MQFVVSQTSIDNSSPLALIAIAALVRWCRVEESSSVRCRSWTLSLTVSTV
jgi:hypothetical protein